MFGIKVVIQQILDFKFLEFGFDVLKGGLHEAGWLIFIES